jgi:hypothetical protein
MQARNARSQLIVLRPRYVVALTQDRRLDEQVEISAWWTPDRPNAWVWALDAAVVASNAAAAKDRMSILRMMPSLKVLTGSKRTTTMRRAQSEGLACD